MGVRGVVVRGEMFYCEEAIVREREVGESFFVCVGCEGFFVFGYSLTGLYICMLLCILMYVYVNMYIK